MRHRPLQNSESYLASVPDPAPQPGREPPSLVDKLRDLGVPESSLRPLETLILTEGMKAAASHMLEVRLKLGNTPAARALDRAMGGDDETLAEAAERSGTSRQAIHTAERRIRARLGKSG